MLRLPLNARVKLIHPAGERRAAEVDDRRLVQVGQRRACHAREHRGARVGGRDRCHGTHDREAGQSVHHRYPHELVMRPPLPPVRHRVEDEVRDDREGESGNGAAYRGADHRTGQHVIGHQHAFNVTRFGVLSTRPATPGSVSTMLDRRFIRDNPEAVKDAVRVKGIDLDVDELLSLDQSSRELQRELDAAQTRAKAFAKEFARADEATRTRLKIEHDEQDLHLKEVRDRLAKVNQDLQTLLLLTPTIPWQGAPVGADDSANVTIKVWGDKPVFDFEVRDHVDLLESRGWAEFARARKVAGERAYALTGDMVLLERALLSYALDYLVSIGSTVISVPVMVREDALVGTGQFPAHREETYALPADDLYLAGTAEVALVGLHSGEILDAKALPIRYAGISPCFRREAGSAGRDVRGLLRVHQFEKVEQFIICAADDEESDRWHAELLGAAEHLLQGLGLHYEVVECATGDMGAGKYRMNDVEHLVPVARPVPRDAQLLLAARLAGAPGERPVPRHRRDGEVRVHAEQHRDRDAPAARGGGGELPDSRPQGPGAAGASAVPRRPRRALVRPH